MSNTDTNTSRTAVLGKIRRALGRDSLDAQTRTELDARVNEPPHHVRPRLNDDTIAQFCDKLSAGGGTWQRVASFDAIPGAIKDYLSRQQLPARVLGAPALAGQPWTEQLDMDFGTTHGDDPISVTPCFCAVAETGSVVLLSSPESPTSLNFLPDDHIVVVRTEQIVGHIEEVWPQLRALDDIPRSVNFITGPSKTADVEQTLQIGAHGPRRLHIVLVDE